MQHYLEAMDGFGYLKVMREGIPWAKQMYLRIVKRDNLLLQNFCKDYKMFAYDQSDSFNWQEIHKMFNKTGVEKNNFLRPKPVEQPKEVQKTPEKPPSIENENSDENAIKEEEGEDEEDENEKMLREERERREMQKKFDKFNNRVNKHILKELMKYVLEDFLDLFHMQQVELECKESGKCSAKLAAYKIIMNADTTETNAIIQ